MDIQQIRALFPVTSEAVYLNSASQAPLNTLVYNKLQSILNTSLNPIGAKGFNRNNIRELLAKLLGGTPQEFALVTSTGVGIGMLAGGISFAQGDNVVIPEREHWNNTFPWMELERQGVEIRLAALNADNSINPDAFEQLIDNHTRVVAVAAVRYNSGFRPNLEAIGQLAHKHGAIFMVDVAQAAGMIPIDVEQSQIDVMAGCGFKWLLGMHGTGYMYVSNRVVDSISPVLPGMYAAHNQYKALNYYPDARKFETGTLAYTLFDAWTAGLNLVQSIGVQHIYDTALAHTDVLIQGLQAKGFNIISPIKNRAERTAILHFNAGNMEDTKKLYDTLTHNKVLVTLQGENIRVSPNFFNTKTDLETLLNLL